MLDKDQVAIASRTLHGHWRAGTKLDGLDPTLRPRDRIEGYAIQAEIARSPMAKLLGWKIAATSEAGQKHINVAGSMAGNEMRVAEPEFAFRMRTDLPPRPSAYTIDEVLAAVDTLHPAIEIPDS